MNFKGFSLIELMVVIAIVAILAAVAIPSYRNYIIGSNIDSLIPAFNTIVDKSILFAQTNGRFGNAYDIGLSATSGSTSIDNPQNFGALWAGTQGNTQVQDTSSSTPCGQYGVVSISFNPALLGFNSSITSFNLEARYWYANKVVSRYYTYYYGNFTSGVSGTANLAPGLVNMDAGTSFDFTYLNPSNSSYNSATCQ